MGPREGSSFRERYLRVRLVGGGSIFLGRGDVQKGFPRLVF